MTPAAFISGLGALVALFLGTVVRVLRDQGAARQREQQEKEDAELQKKYDEIARVGRDAGRTERMLDNGGF